MVADYKALFSPIEIGGCAIKNRFAMAAMGPLGLSDSDGGFNQRGIDYYVARAKGGCGLIITGVTFVDNEVEEHGMPNCPCSTHNPIQFIRTARELTERIHAYNSKIFIQLSGGLGRVAMPNSIGDFPAIAPSPIPHHWVDKTCRQMTIAEIKQIVTQFGKGALNAKRAGFDGVQIHAVHEGYLIDQFAISLFNQRSDEYGGSLENRLRFAKEIVDEIKRCCGADFPVTLRYSPKSFIKDFHNGALPDEEFVEMGRDIPEGIEAAKLLAAYGYDALDVDVGSYDSWWWSHPPMYMEKGMYMPYAKLTKQAVNVPVICAGRMDNPELAVKALNEGYCDMIGLGRPLLADPDYVHKLRAGKTEHIRPCLSCHEGCMGRIQQYSIINCAVNPQACRERYTALVPALRPKKVMIAGGGVAGCEAARVLKLRGHQPEIFEKTDMLGGNLIPGGMPPFKEDDHALAKWYNTTLKALGVPVHFHTEATVSHAAGFDAVIVATGSKPISLPLGNDQVYYAADILLNPEKAGSKAVIVGGGLVGCELALWLRALGKDIAIVEAASELMSANGPLCSANLEMLKQLLYSKDVEVITNCRASKYENGKIALTNGKEISCNSVILAVGYSENNSLFQALEYVADEVYLLGDARKVSNIMYAIWDAFEVASQI